VAVGAAGGERWEEEIGARALLCSAGQARLLARAQVQEHERFVPA